MRMDVQMGKPWHTSSKWSINKNLSNYYPILLFSRKQVKYFCQNNFQNNKKAGRNLIPASKSDFFLVKQSPTVINGVAEPDRSSCNPQNYCYCVRPHRSTRCRPDSCYYYKGGFDHSLFEVTTPFLKISPISAIKYSAIVNKVGSEDYCS